MKEKNEMTGQEEYITRSLKLENDGVQPYLTIPSNCVHIIEPVDGQDSDAPKSPLAGLSRADMLKKEVRICVVFRGWDTALEREVYHRWFYNLISPSNIIFDHHFQPMHVFKDGVVHVNLARLHQIVKDKVIEM